MRVINLNQKYVVKLLFLHICWNLDASFTLSQAHSRGGIQGQCPYI